MGCPALQCFWPGKSAHNETCDFYVRMALISMVLLPVLCVSSFLYFKKVRSQFTLSDEAEGKLSATLQENLAGVRVVRAFGQQRDEVEKFTTCNADFRDKTFKLTQLMGIYWGASDAVGYTQIALTLFTGILFVVKGKLTLGSLMMFTTYAGMLTWPVRQLGRVLKANNIENPCGSAHVEYRTSGDKARLEPIFRSLIAR